ncbi:MAG: NAD(P)-dependent oxidoreductase [Robiginitomaculum sp.]|nr:NAD(P)-dependent oxidoreductase [Robiginitomaculum sp.]
MAAIKNLKGKTIFMSGGSRGIGLAIALRAARDGANVAIAAKTAEPHAKLPGTIYTAAAEIEAAGGKALALICDVRNEEVVQAAIDETVVKFGGIDICINNASAVTMTNVEATSMKRYDLMNSINARGTFLVSKLCLPLLKKSDHAHIINLAPPLDMSPKWFKNHTAYTMAKYGMSMCTLGMAEEFKSYSIGVNSLWPLTPIDTAAVRNVLGGKQIAEMCRTPDIMSDTAHIMMCKDPSTFTGNFVIDEEFLRAEGVTDFAKYAHAGEGQLAGDFFVPDEVFDRLPNKYVRAY